MKKILIILFFPFIAYGQTTPLSFTPLANNDYTGPGRGFEKWNGHIADNSDAVRIPGGMKNQYNRYNSYDFITTTRGVYNFGGFDNDINHAIDSGYSFSFGVMTLYPFGSTGGVSGLSYPLYLHNLMQALPAGQKDWLNSSGRWIENWNSTEYLTFWSELNTAIANHIAAGSHSGVAYRKVIEYVDIRGYGDYGEWHECCYLLETPAAARATSATLQAIINTVKTAFPGYPLVIPIAAFDHGNPTSTNHPLDMSYYALTTTNSWGQIGWRWDTWGTAGQDATLANNPYSFNGLAFNTAILNKYKFAPVVGEPTNSATDAQGSCGSYYCDLTREFNLYRPTLVGNGNFPISASNSGLQTNILAASRQMGYNLKPTGGSMTTTLTPSGQFTISINYSNSGLSPIYDGWKTYIVARQSGVDKWTGISTFDPKPLAAGSSLTQTDVFTFGALPTGNYDFYLIIKDTASYKAPLPLMITGRQGDGSYLIRSGVVVTGANVPPTAQANGTGSITLPINSVSVDGTQSTAQPGGSIVSYAWSQLAGGPNTASNSTPTASTTTFGGMIVGTYNFKLLVTDNNGLTGADTLTVVVNAAGTNLTVFTTQTPPTTIHNDGQALTLGMKFRSTIDAYVIGASFYKVVGNNGTHQGMLYDNAGNLLAQVVFQNETASGWQTALFSNPVLIANNTTYMITYFSPGGFYIYTTAGLATAVVNNTLTGLADGTDGFNGMYQYATSPAYPQSHSLVGGGKVNYWVDVIVAANIGSSCGPNCMFSIPYKKVSN